MKIFYNTLAVCFIILTLGACNIELKYSDGTCFHYVGWVKRIEDMLQE